MTKYALDKFKNTQEYRLKHKLAKTSKIIHLNIVISIFTLNMKDLKPPLKEIVRLDRKKRSKYMLQETNIKYENIDRLKVTGW